MADGMNYTVFQPLPTAAFTYAGPTLPDKPNPTQSWLLEEVCFALVLTFTTAM